MQMDKIRLNKYSINIDKFVFYFCIIDIMFLPYVWFISMSYSLFVLIFWYAVKCKGIKLDLEFKSYVIFVLLMIASTVISFIIYPRYIGEYDIWITNIKRLIQYSTCFLYYFFFKYYIQNYRVKIKKIFYLFFIFALALALIYFVDKSLFATVKSFWNNKDYFVTAFYDGSLANYRYNFTWTDPNNPAYAFVAILAYMCINIQTKIWEKIVLLGMTALILIASMSKGAMLALAIVMAMFFLHKMGHLHRCKYLKKSVIIYVSLIISAIPLLILAGLKILNSSVFNEALDRVVNYQGSSRIDIWINALVTENILKYLIVGRGEMTIFNGSYGSTHNGHLYLIYAFGFIAYYIFMFIVFRINKGEKLYQKIFLIPFFIAFTINIGIGEQKFLLILLLMIALSRYSQSYSKKIVE